MGFQVKTASGEAIGINALDKEAAEFWKKQVLPKEYAYPEADVSIEGVTDPKERFRIEMDSAIRRTNWFDTIGYAIHRPAENYTKGWGNVKHSLCVNWTGGLYKVILDKEARERFISATAELCKPMFELIDHWESKGYTPHQEPD